MNDNFTGQDRLDWSARIVFSITPSDDVQLAYVTKAIYVGTAGNVSVMPIASKDNNAPVAVVFNCPQGSILPVRAQKVMLTGTTANMNLVGLA